MAWNHWLSISTSTDATKWEFWREWYRALGEKWAAFTGLCYFPRMVTPWADGVITGATENTITDSAANWVITAGCTGTSRWVGYSCTDQAHVPDAYDVLIEVDPTDPRKVIRKPITANTSTVLTIESLAYNRDISKQFSAYGDLVGKTYRIVRRAGSGYPTWNERWIDAPNAILDIGTATAVGVGTLTAAGKNWTPGAYVGAELISQESGAFFRVAITANTADTLTFSGGNTPTVGGFDIVAAGSVYLDQNPGQPFRWYAGAGEQVLSIYPDGAVNGSFHPVQELPVLIGQEDCAEEMLAAFDTDLWTDFDDQCTPEKNFSANFYKAPIRASQAFLESICIHFVDRNLSSGATAIPQLTPAMTHKLAGINHATTSATSSAGDVSFSISLPSEHSSIEILYGLYSSTGALIGYGTTNTGSTFATTVPTPEFDGQSITLVSSRGFDRLIERQVRYIYPRTYFEPDLTGGGAVIDPPNDVDGETGTWVTRDADTSYTEWTAAGFPGAGADFVNGNKVRYTAHAYHDGDIAGASIVGTPPADIEYIKHAEEFTPADLAAYNASKQGAATTASNRQLTDATKTWATVMRAETGTATGGSTTTLTDSTKSASALWNVATGRWVGFVLEVKISTGPDVWEKRPVTAHTGTTLTVEPAFSASTSGKDYAMVEPDNVLNRWQGRTIRVTHAGADHDAVITHSDVNTLFFPDIGITIDPTDPYRIIELTPGHVISRTGGAWAALADGEKEHPTTVDRFGRARNRDFLTPTLLQQMKDFSDQLKKRQADVSFHGWADDSETEQTGQFISDIGSGPAYEDGDNTACGESRDLADDFWNDPLEVGTSNFNHALAPQASELSIFSTFRGSPATHSVSLFRRSAYASTIDVNACLNRTVEMWLFGDSLGAADGTVTGPVCGVIGDPGSGYYQENFHAQGTGVLYRQWAPIGSGSMPAGDSESPRISVSPAPSTKPSYGACPPTASSSCIVNSQGERSGFRVTDSRAIIDYAMEFIT